MINWSIVTGLSTAKSLRGIIDGKQRFVEKKTPPNSINIQTLISFHIIQFILLIGFYSILFVPVDESHRSFLFFVFIPEKLVKVFAWELLTSNPPQILVFFNECVWIV